ncbi:MAG: Nitroreductase [Bacteroidetes bacterium]|nr:Nitroreductase [Bacteroidota bacterium]
MTAQSESDITNTFVPQRLDTRAPLNELLGRRWSPRAFSEREIEPAKILTLFEAARWSPSSANEQPWHFIAATKEDTRINNALFESLTEGNRRWARRAPMLVLGVAQSVYSKSGRAYHHAWYDLGQSVANLTVQASALGLAVHQMGGFDAGKVRELLSIPEGYEPVVVFAVGYAERPETLPDDLRRREEEPRSRKPLETMVFTEGWGKASRLVDAHNSVINDPRSKN